MIITTVELLDGRYQLDIIKEKNVFGYCGTARQVEKIMVLAYKDIKKALKLCTRYAVIN